MKELLAKLAQSDKVVTTVLQKGTHFKVLALAFKAGMVFPKHQTKQPAKLIVLEGNVTYEEENGQSVALDQYDEHPIPVNIPHWVTAHQPSLCLLIIGE
ncbi:hypothetical protein BKI52_17160 [marine bacterium AO1-C]|nr:hypothetical protein BKI52_17160 [marine bacterium AO1-C]